MDLAERRDIETQVYQPAEDTDLLRKTAEAWVESGDRVLEVGTGSGYIAAKLADLDAAVVGADVNPHACRQARENGVEAVRADLVAPFRDDSFDWVVFNPPYLPRDKDAERDDWMEVALTGGENGRALIEPFVETVRRVLKPGGEALMLASSLTGLDAVRDHARANGFATMEAASESHPFERLVVLRLITHGHQTD